MNIDILDKNVVRISDTVSVYNFTGLSEMEHQNIHMWRTHPDTAEYSMTKQISWNDHVTFVKGLKKARDKAYWLIKHKNEPVAVCNLHNITERSAYSGNYIVPGKLGYGVLANLVIQDIAFNKLVLSILYGEVLPENEAVLRIAKFFDARWTLEENGYIKTMQTQQEWQNKVLRYNKLMRAFK